MEEDNKQIWNDIINLFNKYKDAEEFKIQTLWENIFKEYLNYKTLEGDISSHKEMMIGAAKKIIPDIVVGKNNKDYAVVELKKECFDACDKKHFEQLLSYLKLLKIPIGILIANKINIIVYDYNKDDKYQQSIQIEFDKDNPLGEKFVNLFKKENLDENRIKDFVNENYKIEKDKQELEKIINDEEFIKSILANYFKENDYNQIAIDLLFNDYKISSTHKVILPLTPTPSTKLSPKLPTHTLKKSISHKLSKENTLYKERAIVLCKKHNISIPEYNTFANYNGKKYPANVNLDYLNHDWFILLNNNEEKKLHILKIPANTFCQSDFYIRTDRNLIVLAIDSDFVDDHPFCEIYNDLSNYIVGEIDYSK